MGVISVPCMPPPPLVTSTFTAAPFTTHPATRVQKHRFGTAFVPLLSRSAVRRRDGSRLNWTHYVEWYHPDFEQAVGVRWGDVCGGRVPYVEGGCVERGRVCGGRVGQCSGCGKQAGSGTGRPGAGLSRNQTRTGGLCWWSAHS